MEHKKQFWTSHSSRRDRFRPPGPTSRGRSPCGSWRPRWAPAVGSRAGTTTKITKSSRRARVVKIVFLRAVQLVVRFVSAGGANRDSRTVSAWSSCTSRSPLLGTLPPWHSYCPSKSCGAARLPDRAKELLTASPLQSGQEGCSCDAYYVLSRRSCATTMGRICSSTSCSSP